jgi:hypothetical protein
MNRMAASRRHALATRSQRLPAKNFISKASKQLKRIDNVFVVHGWIEPNETIDDIKIIKVPTQKNIVIQLEVEVFGHDKWLFREHKTKLSASTAFSLIGDATTFSSTSEDEQNVYEETEAAIAGIETNVNRADAMLESPSLREEDRKGLSKLIEQGTRLLGDLPERRDLLHEAWKLIKALQEYLDSLLSKKRSKE